MTTNSTTSKQYTVYDEEGRPHTVTEENELDANGQIKSGFPVFKCATRNGSIVSNLPAGFTIDGVFYTSIDPSKFNQAAPDVAKAAENMRKIRENAVGRQTAATPKKTD